MKGLIGILCEYWYEGIRPKSRFARILVPLLAVKIAVISLLWVLFFGPSTQPEVGVQAIDTAVFSLSTSPSEETRP
jgi:hypothetical protein